MPWLEPENPAADAIHLCSLFPSPRPWIGVRVDWFREEVKKKGECDPDPMLLCRVFFFHVATGVGEQGM